ncbi:MAG: sulfite exporter TauE/SafE family protein [bacterium]
MTPADLLLPLAIFLIAALYSAIGQGGASGYLALMAIGGISTTQMRPAALALNILVSATAAWKFSRAGHFSRQIFWPAIIGGAPMAMLGASIDLPEPAYKTMVALVLLYAAARLLQSTRHSQASADFIVNPPPMPVTMAGGLIGLVSGLTGNGGGIFLSPIMLLAHWSNARVAAGTAALFTLVNSVAGLAIVSRRIDQFPEFLWLWMFAAGLGGWLGAEFGLKGLSENAARKCLAFALALAAVRSLVAILSWR